MTPLDFVRIWLDWDRVDPKKAEKAKGEIEIAHHGKAAVAMENACQLLAPLHGLTASEFRSRLAEERRSGKSRYAALRAI